MNGRQKAQTEYVNITVKRYKELSRAAYWLNRYREAIDQPDSSGLVWIDRLDRLREMDRMEGAGDEASNS